ncbi:MAG: HdeD family acid-resistance protein [Peptostreptococcaceae bacterium]
MKIAINKSYINRGNLLFTGISLIVVSIITFYARASFLNLVMKAFATAFIINGLSQIINGIIINKNDIAKPTTISQSILNFMLGFGILMLPTISLSILPIVFALYLLLNGIAKLITIFIYWKNDIKIKFRLVTKCIIYFVFGITSLLAPLSHLNDILFIISIYLFLFGLDFMKDFISEIIPQKAKNKFKRKVRITLPVFLVAMIPHRVLKKVNAYLEVENEDANFTNDNSEEPDLEVFIHVTPSGVGMVGHVDLFYNGEIMSYGNYDESSYKLYGMIGRGVLFSCDKDKYIDFCLNYGNKTLFSYGLRLNEEQKINIEKRIKEIKGNLVEWIPPVVFENNNKGVEKYTDYASMLYKSTGAKFYKFNSGRFKTYFGLNTNCVLLADSVIGRCGTDVLSFSGIITPGTYYEYFKNEFGKRNSMVITRTIYTDNVTTQSS